MIKDKMMLQYNKVIQAGTIVSDPELRSTGSGVSVVNFRLAVNTKLSADNTKTMFIDVAVFGAQAEAVQQYCHKGSNVLVEGRLDEDQWLGDGGEKHFKHFITAYSVKFVDAAAKKEESVI
jgi:single-strand DNA-binding protein